MACRVCTELETTVTSSLKDDPPNHLQGLTEVGERNRKHQHEERILKARATLHRHQLRCPDRAQPSEAEGNV